MRSGACSMPWRSSLTPTTAMIIYIVGDKGSSAEGGFEGTINENNVFNRLANTCRKASSSSTSWAARSISTTSRAMGLGDEHAVPIRQSGRFGGTRNPLIISWPARIKDKGGLRTSSTT